ncbi:hypothetical protein FOMPIDRAFT_154541 [Fomitopsis schrenkii]|uniref:Uncharacterized protein n=1 Tax=Fomitopsis schrenkii TaxID=2126942 RepID=S8E1D4_FOMSC|nr:hypothetical protein FOMPIDRAFT_154541 [Fomitopsis schrenkii]
MSGRGTVYLAAGTSLTTLTSESVSTWYSASVSSLEATKSTVTSCGTTTLGFFPVPTCSTYETSTGGGASTFQVPVTTTVTLTQAITSTLYGTTCSSGSSSASSDSSSHAPSASATSGGLTTSTTDSRSYEKSAIPTSTTIAVQTTETTVVGGVTVTTQVTSLEVVAVTAATVVVASVPAGSGLSGHSSNSNNDSTPDGAIIGAIVGGIAALVLLAFGFAFFLREKKRPDDEFEKDPQPDTPMVTRMLRKRQGNKNDLDLDAEARPFTEGLPYHDDPGNQTMETIPPPLPQKENPPMRFIARLKPLPLSPRATWYSARTIPAKHQHQHQQPQSNRSSSATIRPTPPPQLPQLTVDPPSPPGQYTPFLHVANTSPRDSALLTPPPLPEKGGFMPLPRKGKAPEPRDGTPPPMPPTRSQSPRSSFRASFFGTPALRMPIPFMSPVSRSVVQHEDGGPAQAGPSSAIFANLENKNNPPPWASSPSQTKQFSINRARVESQEISTYMCVASEESA